MYSFTPPHLSVPICYVFQNILVLDLFSQYHYLKFDTCKRLLCMCYVCVREGVCFQGKLEVSCVTDFDLIKQ